MSVDERERLLLEKVKNELDTSVAELDRETLRRLREARVSALDLAERRHARRIQIPRWLTAGSLATVAVMVVAVSIWIAEPRQGLPVKQPEDMEILTAHEHLDMYKDLEFYRWLADMDNER
jgi:hypothetical protein